MLKKLKKLLIVLVAFIVAGTLFWEFAFPHICSIDNAELEKFTPLTRYRDRYGDIVHVEPGYDYQRRIPVPLETLPQHLVDITLAVEDRNFFNHDGVDIAAVFRAGFQLLTNGRIVSGASTITMQLVSMAEGRERSFSSKIAQMSKARNFELSRGKNEILELYFNLLPYGGKIYGIEAAANYYFGRSAQDLNLAESILLAGLPQAPNRFRPDKHPEAAKKRQEIVLQMLVRQKFFTESEANEIRMQPLRLRDCSLPMWKSAKDPQFFMLAKKESPGKFDYTTTLDTSLQTLALAALKSSVAAGIQINDAAAIIVENKSGAIRALVGTLDFSNPNSGQVNAAVALRSPGSLLKPFFYGEAINGGIIVAETLVEDSPLTLADYRPGNFDGTFRGNVPANIALADSLNTPAIRILQTLGIDRATGVLAKFGIETPPGKSPQEIGLSLALGGSESRLLDLAGAYAGIVNNRKTPLCFLETSAVKNLNTEASANPIWQAGTSQMLLQMLQTLPLENAETLPAAWKTGTSNGMRDAWCIACTPKWTVAVWFGNKNGNSAPGLVGAKIAAPAAGKILSALYKGKAPEGWNFGEEFHTILLCRESGLAASEFCRTQYPGTAIRNIPLKTCPLCRAKNSKQPMAKPTKISSPKTGVFRTGIRAKAKFVLNCVPAKVHAYLNREYIGELSSGHLLELAPGKYTLFFWGGEGYAGTQVQLEIKK